MGPGASGGAAAAARGGPSRARGKAAGLQGRCGGGLGAAGGSPRSAWRPDRLARRQGPGAERPGGSPRPPPRSGLPAGRSRYAFRRDAARNGTLRRGQGPGARGRRAVQGAGAPPQALGEGLPLRAPGEPRARWRVTGPEHGKVST